MLEELPELREKAREYVEKHYESRGSVSKLGF
jgi:hypothetical protein